MAVKTHSAMQCDGYPCVVHNPSDHHMKDWPIVYRIDRAVEMPEIEIDGTPRDKFARAVVRGPVFVLAERTCEHGVGHPDPDSIEFARRQAGDDFANAESVHGCDLCCRSPHKAPPESKAVKVLEEFVEAQPVLADGTDLDALLAGPFHFLPDDHPDVIALRERFNAALDAQEPKRIVLGLDGDEDEQIVAAEFDAMLASGERVMVTVPPAGWTGPIRMPYSTTVTWHPVEQKATIPWDEPIWLALKPVEKMDAGTLYSVVLGYYDGDSFAEYSGLSMDNDVTHWADVEYPSHPVEPPR